MLVLLGGGGCANMVDGIYRERGKSFAAEHDEADIIHHGMVRPVPRRAAHDGDARSGIVYFGSRL